MQRYSLVKAEVFGYKKKNHFKPPARIIKIKTYLVTTDRAMTESHMLYELEAYILKHSPELTVGQHKPYILDILSHREISGHEMLSLHGKKGIRAVSL